MQVEEALRAVPEVEGFFAVIGLRWGGGGNSALGYVFTRLSHWDERDVKQQEIVGSLFREFCEIPEALVFPINLPSLGRRSLSDVEFVLKSSSASLDEFAPVNEAILARARRCPAW